MDTNAWRISHIASPAPPSTSRCDVVVVRSRGTASPWWNACITSVQLQDDAHAGVIVVDNDDHALSIGAAWNLAVRASSAEYVLFVGDDDAISFDLVRTLRHMFDRLLSVDKWAHLQTVTSGMTMVNEKGAPVAPLVQVDTFATARLYLQQHHTGMWRREWLLTHPFNETLTRHVDADILSRLDQWARLQGVKPERVKYAIGYHYGYQYRQHVGQVSGQKLAVVRG
jgi:glycosyltransferase involved in cell wall biosynthesis